MRFYKYQGAGNDFILLDARQGVPIELTRANVARLCDRRFGIGADGLMSLQKSDNYDFTMRYFNSDGGESTMCGNGGRCIARCADDLGIGGVVKIFEAVDGVHRATTNGDGTISLQMIDIECFTVIGNDFLLNSGSPHYVTLSPYDLTRARTLRQVHNCNVNFVEIVADGKFKIRTFERGVEAETLACGTGATAAAAIVHWALQDNIQSFDIEALGGILNVAFTPTCNALTDVVLTGPATKVFEGSINF